MSAAANWLEIVIDGQRKTMPRDKALEMVKKGEATIAPVRITPDPVIQESKTRH